MKIIIIVGINIKEESSLTIGNVSHIFLVLEYSKKMRKKNYLKKLFVK